VILRVMSKREVIAELRESIAKEKSYIEVAPSRCREEGKIKIAEMEEELRRLLA
jgi:hypothetical protein